MIQRWLRDGWPFQAHRVSGLVVIPSFFFRHKNKPSKPDHHASSSVKRPTAFSQESEMRTNGKAFNWHPSASDVLRGENMFARKAMPFTAVLEISTAGALEWATLISQPKRHWCEKWAFLHQWSRSVHSKSRVVNATLWFCKAFNIGTGPTTCRINVELSIHRRAVRCGDEITMKCRWHGKHDELVVNQQHLLLSMRWMSRQQWLLHSVGNRTFSNWAYLPEQKPP